MTFKPTSVLFLDQTWPTFEFRKKPVPMVWDSFVFSLYNYIYFLRNKRRQCFGGLTFTISNVLEMQICNL